jgi:hypothetical protein
MHGFDAALLATMPVMVDGARAILILFLVTEGGT